MKCLDCKADILAKDTGMCPYCFSKNLVSDEVVLESEKAQPITSKLNEVTCSYCKKNYVIPKKILELL